MRVFISADIEGVTGIAHWDEANKDKRDYAVYRAQMQAEVRAACEAALEAGATAVRVKDAHASGRNLDPRDLPSPTELVRGWAPTPAMMVQEIESGFDALVFIGYHDCAGSGGNPLSHTLTTRITEMRVNGQPVAEFHLHTWVAAVSGVPAVFLSGDEGICGRVRAFDERIRTVSTNLGRGDSVLSRHPEVVLGEIREGVTAALASPPPVCTLPENFVLEVDYKLPQKAWRNALYPGAELTSDRTVRFEANDWLEIMRALEFIT